MPSKPTGGPFGYADIPGTVEAPHKGGDRFFKISPPLGDILYELSLSDGLRNGYELAQKC
jgi:hypothetical protein